MQTKPVSFPEGMTIAELKAVLEDWPEIDAYGNPCEVWVYVGAGISAPITMAETLNRRQKDAGLEWADLMLGYDMVM